MTSKEAKLLRRMAKGRWPITDVQRIKVINSLVHTACAAEDERARVGAGKTLTEMDKLNMAEQGVSTGNEVTVNVRFDTPKPLD